MDGPLGTVQRPRREVDHEITDAVTRARTGGRAPAERGVQSCHELARGEWSRETVICAGVEGADQLVLVRNGRDEDERHRAPLAQASAQVDSIAARRLRSDDRRVRRAQPGAVVGVGRRRGRLDGEAGVAEDRGQRAPHLRMVVADEDP
jgi:hypothetical protein